MPSPPKLLQKIKFYNFPLCFSSFQLQNAGSASAHDIDGVKFAGSEKTFDNGAKYKKSACYCPRDGCSVKPGVRNFTDFFVSFPHFYSADESYRNSIEGMHPDPQKHEFNVILQKVTIEF